MAVVNSHGYSLSSDQLTRWHRRGLVPRPKQDHLGRPGSQTVYPSGTTEQVIEICRLRVSKRRLEHIAWELWWNGYVVSLRTVRKFTQNAVTKWIEYTQSFIEMNAEITSSEIEASSEKRLKNKSLRRMRKRVGSQNFPSIVQAVLDIAVGRYSKDSFDAEEDQINIEKAAGITNAREQKLGLISPWISGEQLNGASKFFEVLNFLAILSDISDEEFIQARNEFRSFLDSLESAGQVIDKTFGEKAFGFSSGAGLLKETPIMLQPLLILFWITIQKTKDAKKFLEITVKNTTIFSEIVFQDKALELLKTEIPAIGEKISARKIRAASRSQRGKQKFIAELQQIYSENEGELDQFWKRHPEFLIAKN